MQQSELNDAQCSEYAIYYTVSQYMFLSKSDAVKSVWQAFENYVTGKLLFTMCNCYSLCVLFHCM